MAGSLTENRLVVKAYIEDKIINSVEEQTWKEETKRMLGLAITNNSTAEPNLTCANGVISGEQIGDKTECALLEMALAMGYDYRDWRDKERQKKVFPFSADRQKMSTLYTDHHGNDYAFVKGAPEAMIPHCTHFLDAQGTVTPINE
jgi:Ca2+-transporting ATPase